MNILNELSCMQNIKDEIPNQQLAKKLAESKNIAGIKEIVENLWNKNKNIQSDCIKVLYEIGFINPELIKEYYMDFIKLLKSKKNRLIWGAMIGLSTIAEIKYETIFEYYDDILDAMKSGSVITIDNGIKILSIIASKDEKYNKIIFPYLLDHIKTCRTKEIPMHSEFISVAINNLNKNEFIKVLKSRESELSDSQLKRINKIYKKAY